MFVIGNLLEALAAVLNLVLTSLMFVIFISAILSWVRSDQSHPIVMLLERIADLVCSPIRKVLPTSFGGIDFAPFIAMVAMWFIKMFVVNTLRDLAIRL